MPVQIFNGNACDVAQKMSLWMFRYSPSTDEMVVAFFFILVVARAESQIDSTVIVIAYSKQKIIVSTDSREINREGGYRVCGCKITAPDGKFIFVADGKTKSSLNGNVLWDASQEARRAFDSARNTKQYVGWPLDDIAGNWGGLMGHKIADNISHAEALALTDDEKVIEGFFIGIDSGELHISHEVIRASITDNIPKIDVKPVLKLTISDAMTYVAFAEDDVAYEFVSAKTKRSKAWIKSVPHYAKSHHIADVDAAKAILIVELTGIYGKERVVGHPDIHIVGGPIDAIAINRKGEIGWIQRKQECPEN